MKSVAIVGFADETFADLETLDPALVEVWSLGRAHEYASLIARADKLFEIHSAESLSQRRESKPREHFSWLQKSHDFPVYMQETQVSVDDGRTFVRYKFPSAVRYPIEDVIKNLFGDKLLRDGKAQKGYFTCTVAWMVAFAIHENYDVVYPIGIELGTQTEYRYQKAGVEALLLLAIGRGISVELPADSLLLKSKLYGYEGGQMLGKDNLNKFHASFVPQKRGAVNTLSYTASVYADTVKAFRQGSIDQEALDEAFRFLKRDLLRAGIASGALSAVVEMKKKVGSAELFRQDVEVCGGDFSRELTRAMSTLNFIESQYASLLSKVRNNGVSYKDLDAMQEKLENALFKAGVANGALQVAKLMIDEIDLQEPSLVLKDPFSTVDV